MQRLVIAVIVVAIVFAIGAALLRGARRVYQDVDGSETRKAGENMQKIAFFLLLALMIYAFGSGLG